MPADDHCWRIGKAREQFAPRHHGLNRIGIRGRRPVEMRHLAGMVGDVKFLAAAGIWVGVAGIPMLLLVAALTALACAGLMQLAGRQLNAQTSISFGPFLATGLLFAAAFPPS